jgi:hypothetical protein
MRIQKVVFPTRGFGDIDLEELVFGFRGDHLPDRMLITFGKN